MNQDFCKIPVSPEIEPEVRVLVRKMQEASRPEGFSSDDITLIKPDARHFTGVEIPPAVFVISLGALTWFAKAWADKYLKQVLLDAVDEPSREFQKWLKQVLSLEESKGTETNG